jgi:hypothetical protein
MMMMMMMMTKIIIFSVKQKNVRTVNREEVLVKGCHMQCFWEVTGVLFFSA